MRRRSSRKVERWRRHRRSRKGSQVMRVILRVGLKMILRLKRDGVLESDESLYSALPLPKPPADFVIDDQGRALMTHCYYCEF
ncbi:hypothetical protein ACS0TY_029613 [Phlomoides rotata]